jgi:hypothetical protein
MMSDSYPLIFRMTIFNVIFCMRRVYKNCFTKKARIKIFHVRKLGFKLYKNFDHDAHIMGNLFKKPCCHSCRIKFLDHQRKPVLEVMSSSVQV